MVQAYRDSPTLLDYVPFYKGVLRKKDKRKEGEPSRRKRGAPSGTKGAKKGLKQLRVRLPTFRKNAEFWFGPPKPSDVEEPILPGLNVPLQFIDPSAEDMSRKNIARPVIPTRM